ncbi:DUF1697 domain-containing protein [soil metagenome]
MNRHVAFLRAINVGGRRVTNIQLADAVIAAGFGEVGTFLASGNVLYHPGGLDLEASTTAIEEALQTHLGFTVEAFVRDGDQLALIEAAVPFAEADLAAATSAPQVALLRQAPDAETTAAVHAMSTEADQLQVIGRELHWLPREGLGRTALDVNALNRVLGLNTVRSLNTLVRIRAKIG